MILVTGATGNVGSELVRQLVEAGHPVRALVRDPTATQLPDRVELSTGDLDRPESLHDALNGVSRVFLLGGYHDMPGILSAVRAAGAEHVVVLTSRSVVGGSPTNAIVKMWMATEDAVQNSRVPWTILHPTGFMSNALRWQAQLQRGNVIRAPFADAPVAVIDPHDIAAVAVAALISQQYRSKALPLSGPEAMRPADMVAVLGSVLGRELRFEAQSNADARAEMSRAMDASMVDAFFRFFVDGEFDDSQVVPTVQEVTGRPPNSFDQWARAHRGAFA